MLYFIFFLNFIVNFFYGVFIPIIPILSEEYTGLAFSIYGLSKIFSYYIFGQLIDKKKFAPALSLTLLLFVAVPVFYILTPKFPQLAKLLEGMAYAGGTVFCFTFLNLVSKRKEDFEKRVQQVMIFTSIGGLLGPLAGYYFINLSLSLAAQLFLAFSLLINFMAFFYYSKLKKRGDTAHDEKEINSTRAEKLNLNLVMMVLILKGLLMGVQPCIAYWCQNILAFSSFNSALVFLLSGAAFIIGTIKAGFKHPFIAIFSLILLECSFYVSTWFIWPAIFLFSYWVGACLVKSILSLGWVTTDKTGRLNSSWLAISDIPLMVTPLLFWEVRFEADFVLRQALILLMLIAFFFFRSKYGKQVS